MQARIYKPTKSAMQSGTGSKKEWLLTYEPVKKQTDPLMGWVGSADTRSQLRLWFDTKEEAIAYAEKHGVQYTVEEPQLRTVRPKAYADNFAFNRIGRWTH
jgi:hypothetical protein